MGFWGNVWSLGKKAVSGLAGLGKKFLKSAAAGEIGQKLADKAHDVVGSTVGNVLESAAGQKGLKVLHKGAELGDALTGGKMNLKRKAEEAESTLRSSGKLARKAVDLARKRIAGHTVQERVET